MVLATLGEGRYIEVNKAFLRDTGYLKDNVLGRKYVEIGPWPDPEKREEVIRSLRETGKLDAYPIKFRMKDGATRDFLWSARVVDFDNVPCALSGLIDMADRVKSEKEKKKDCSSNWNRCVAMRPSAPLRAALPTTSIIC